MSFNEPVIDIHAMLGVENHLSLAADELLRQMDAHGVELAAARCVGAELTVDNRVGNDRLLNASKRILAWVTVNPWFGQRAVDELRRCHDHGAAGVFLHPARQGFMPTEEIVTPLIELAGELDWPVMFHTGTYVFSDILAVAQVARQYPSVRFVAGFGAFADMWFEMPGVLARVPNIYLDTSLLWGGAIEQIVNEFGDKRVLYGSGLPRNCYAVTQRMMDRLDINPEQRQAVLYKNAKELFHLP